MLEAEMRIEVINAFSQLTETLLLFCNAIQNEPSLIAWVDNTPLFQTAPNSHSPREKACAIYKQLQYTDTQAPREIIVCAGFIGASATTLKLATSLNECKDRFKKTILMLKSAKIKPNDESLAHNIDSIWTSKTSNTSLLKKVGMARLHLKQCYRKIPILNDVPQKISWTWAHTRSIKKITVMQAMQLLQKKGDDPGINIQLQKLSTLSPRESLAIVQELAPHLRANIVFRKGIQLKRSMIKGPIPILFPCDEKTSYPQFNPPKEKCLRDQSRLRRSDVLIEDTPFLPAIRAHRYASA